MNCRRSIASPLRILAMISSSPAGSGRPEKSSANCTSSSSRSRLAPLESVWRRRMTEWLHVATSSVMKTVSIRDAKNRLTELAREVEGGETIVVTRNGRPIFDLVPHRPRKGLRLEAIDEFKRKQGIETIVPYIADDFDDPLLEDFLLRSLPPDG